MTIPTPELLAQLYAEQREYEREIDDRRKRIIEINQMARALLGGVRDRVYEDTRGRKLYARQVEFEFYPHPTDDDTIVPSLTIIGSPLTAAGEPNRRVRNDRICIFRKDLKFKVTE